MASNDILHNILHYKREIERLSDPPERALRHEERMLHCIGKLFKLPVNVSHLQETGVGKTVNSLRKIDGEIGDAAKALVAKWKNMVMLEDEAERKQKEEAASGPSEEDVKRIKLIREAEKADLKKTETSDNSKHKKRKFESDEEEEEEEEEASHSKPRKIENLNGHGSPDYKSSKHKSNSHRSHDDRKEHKSSTSLKPSSSSSSSKHKSSSNSEKSDSKKHKSQENNGINSQSGGSFADALGPILVKKSKKKSNHSSTISSPPNSDYSSDNNSSPVKVKIKEENKTNGPLFPTSALEPLEPDLIETLPVPTPFYKPNPVNHFPIQESTRKRIQTEEDALTTMMSKNNQRTKVYSGVKGGLTRVPSLYEFCCRVLQQHLDAMEYTGGIPFSLLEPVLVTASPSQLYQFEHYNPYIIEDTDELWKRHVNKEFRTEKRQEFESWRDMYLRCVDEREEKFKAVSANIAKSIEKSVPVRKTKLAYIDVAKPPRNILKKQIKNGITKPDTSRLIGKNDPDAVRVSVPKHAPTTREPSILKMKPKVAPLMQKTLKSIKMTRFKR